jgi:hypothetical protein
VPEHVAVARGDPERLQLVLFKMIQNAIRRIWFAEAQVGTRSRFSLPSVDAR